MINKKCPQCSAAFSCTQNQRKYCSKKCSDKSKITSIKRSCLACDKEFDAKMCEVKKGAALLCSRECVNKIVAMKRVTKECENCSTIFTRSKSMKSRFCSRKCYFARTDLCKKKGKDPIDLFKEKIDENFNENKCSLWTAGKDKDGYGLFKGGGKTHRAHRFSYTLYNGEIPKGLVVMHKCDTPSCINPLHLSVGTINDNNQDMKNKKRYFYFNKK